MVVKFAFFPSSCLIITVAIQTDAEKRRGSNEVITSSPVLKTELDQDSNVGYKGMGQHCRFSLEPTF